MIIVGKPFVWDGGSCLTAESVPWGVLIAELGWAEGFRGRWNGTQWGGKDGEEEEVLIKDWLI